MSDIVAETSRKIIADQMKELHEEYGMTEEETSYKITERGKKIIFEIHDGLKKRIEKYLRHNELKHASMTLNFKSESTWLAVIEVDGAESAFFASIIEGVVKRAKKSAEVNANKQLIEHTILCELQKANIQRNTLKRIFYKKKNDSYQVSFSIDRIFFLRHEETDPHVLCNILSERIPTLIKMADNGKKK